MGPVRKHIGVVMLISTHGIAASAKTDFMPSSWGAALNSTFGSSDINDVVGDGSSSFVVAVGDEGKIATSDNYGETWTGRASVFSGSDIFCVEYGDNIYVAGGASGRIASSNDGITWTLRSSGFGSSPVLSIVHSDFYNIWVIVGGDGKLATSTNGINWTLRTSSFGTIFINDVYTRDDALFVAVGRSGLLATSSDGISWTQRTSSFGTTDINACAANEYRYCIVGASGKIATSPNATSWSQILPQSTFGSLSLLDISARTSFVASSTQGKIGTSHEGIYWNQRVSSFGTLAVNSVYFAEDFAVAVGSAGRIAYSIQ